jgi:hypothetical protein
VRIRGYYLPVGSKHIPYRTIRSIQRVNMGALTGRARIWGTANPRYWANLDPKRPSKKIGFVLDVGRSVRPFVTPEDPNGFEAVLSEHCGVAVERGGRIVM